ncbi:MAG: AAA family ATPase, partial [Promethearchaeota archaeon]
MISVSTILDDLFSLLSHYTIVNISGESGTGKTTLALYLGGNFLTSKKPYQHSCIWIQASEIFPKRRLISLFSSNDEDLDYLSNNIYIIPEGRILKSFSEQGQTLRKLINSDLVLPPNLKFIVIDNISHHLRFELSTLSEVRDITNTIDYFFDETLMPLLLFCKRKNIYLILLHEVSFDMNAGQQKPFLQNLYSRLNVLHINLSKIFNNKKKKMKITSE